MHLNSIVSFLIQYNGFPSHSSMLMHIIQNINEICWKLKKDFDTWNEHLIFAPSVSNIILLFFLSLYCIVLYQFSCLHFLLPKLSNTVTWNHKMHVTHTLLFTTFCNCNCAKKNLLLSFSPLLQLGLTAHFLPLLQIFSLLFFTAVKQ